jgi:cytochrome P450
MDRVVGRDRMPTFADQQNLPYLEAFIKETMRYISLSHMPVKQWSDVHFDADGAS